MKYFILSAFLISLVSCNTSIGLYRDAKVGYNWSKEKIQGAGNGGGGGGNQGGDYIY